MRAVDVVQSSYEIMQDALTRHRLAGYSPDLLLTVPKTAARTLDFHRAQEMIALGRRIALESLPELGIRPAPDDDPEGDTATQEPS
jgi:NTE family protein